jgi:TonB family protein
MNTFKMPKYPVEEEKAGIEGSVMFELIVSPQGIPVKARLVRSSRKAFTKISFESVMNSRFHPALKSGKAVFCRFNFPVGFRLRKKH